MTDLLDTGKEPAEEKPHYLGHRQRLRARFLAAPETLPDYEMLELLLCLAVPQRDMKPLAKALIARFGSFAAVISADAGELVAVDGVKESAATALKAVREAAVRLTRQQVMKRPVVSSWEALIDYCQANLAFEKIERFHILFLDRKNALIADEAQQRGTVDHTPVYPREVAKRALELSASAVIMVHNHPSGDPKPSSQDIEMTKQVREALRAVGVALHDHLIIGRGSHASFKGLGLI